MVNPARQVTVGMPVYNDPDGLRRSVPTVFAQTWDGPVRLLLVDDGSDQRTVEVISELTSTYGDIEVVRNERNRGRPHVRNQILEHAGDGWLGWLDAGDLWHPRKLEVQLAALEADEGDPSQPVICVAPLRRYFIDRGTGSIRVPDVDGDQLHAALTGRIFAYLQAMLGPAEAFRSLGFDERLLRRQDYDLLVRFLGEGGRVISTPADLPLFTYLKSDLGGSPEVVAEVNKVIRSKHRAYYQRYSGGLARQVRGNQHRLVARFHESHGNRVQAARYRWLARLADPSGAVGAPTQSAQGSRGRGSALKRSARGLARRVRSLLPALRRLGLISLARRLGIIRIAGRLGLMRIFYKELRREGPPASRSSELEQLIRGGEPERAVERLEGLVAEQRPAPPDHWLLLEEAYRRAGRLHSAHEAIERGLEQHPGERQLRLRLSELLGLRRDWEGCVETWLSLAEVTQDDLSSISHVRAARGLRLLERPHEAVEVAEAGVRRWPDEQRLEEELLQSRSLTVDWAAAIRETGEGAAAAGDRITDLGFLAGGAGPVEGEVTLRAEHASKVSLLLNGREVAATYASPDAEGGGGRGRFSLNCRDLLDHLGDGDVVTLTTHGEVVQTPGGGRRLEFSPGHASRGELLFEKLDDGYVFMKFGRLELGNTPGRKRAILEAYDLVASLFEEELGYTLFPIYGNLLGAVRDHDFIEHDVGGFDVAYVSRHEDPAGVRAELVDICRMLASRRYHLELKPWGIYVRRTRGAKAFVDLNFAWFNPAGELNVSYGWRYPPVTDRERLHLRREGAIFGHLVPVPGNAEDVLEQLYGPDWPIPIQGFDPDAGITRDDRYLLSREEMEALEAEHPDHVRVRSILTAEGEVYVG
jgi:glycosyltransferase involved in cell wall biosynthesis/tetratricopeptide (TPR) repeat protein